MKNLKIITIIFPLNKSKSFLNIFLMMITGPNKKLNRMVKKIYIILNHLYKMIGIILDHTLVVNDFTDDYNS